MPAADVAAPRQTGRSVLIELDPAEIGEFAAATRPGEPTCAPTRHSVVPPTYLAAQMLLPRIPEIDEWLCADADAGVVVEQDNLFFGPPPRAGDQLTMVTRVDAYRQAGPGEATTREMLTQYFDPTERLVAETWTTITRPSAGQEAE